MLVKIVELDCGPARAMRAGFNDRYAKQLRDLYAAGIALPDVVAFDDAKSEKYWLADGNHRVAGASLAGLEHINADVREGTRAAAYLYAAGSNSTHGLPRSAADLNETVKWLIKHPELGHVSDRQIAEVAKCSHTHVANVRNSMEGSTVGKGAKGGSGGSAGKGGRKQGRPAYKWRDWDSKVGPAIREFRKISRNYGDADSPEYVRADRALAQFIDHFEAWKKKLVKS